MVHFLKGFQGVWTCYDNQIFLSTIATVSGVEMNWMRTIDDSKYRGSDSYEMRIA